MKDIPEGYEPCPACRADGCYACGGQGYVSPGEADSMSAENDCDVDDDY